MNETSKSESKQDVRMRGFSSRTTVTDAWKWLAEHVPLLSTETIALCDAFQRVVAEPIVSEVNVPAFLRSMMDGFALKANDIQGATNYNPIKLEIMGESLPNQPFSGTLESGQCIRSMTGAPLPSGANAVLPVEFVTIEERHIQAEADVSLGKNVGQIGEDIALGQVVLQQGRVLRPQDLGVLSSIGVAKLQVTKQPRVKIITTGNELLPPGSKPDGFQIVDANSPMLSALIRRDGGIPIHNGITEDSPNAILAEMRADDADVILVSGGSSVGQEDHAPGLIRTHGSLDIHGIAMRPSSPAGMGRLDGKLVFLLPGNPVSCLCAYDFFAGRAIRQLGGRSVDFPYRTITGKLTRKISSVVGRLDYARVKLDNSREVQQGIEPLAISGASMLSSTTRADGFVIIPADSEGYPPEAEVEVFLYDEV